MAANIEVVVLHIVMDLALVDVITDINIMLSGTEGLLEVMSGGVHLILDEINNVVHDLAHVHLGVGNIAINGANRAP